MISALPRPSTVSRETRHWALVGGLVYAPLLPGTPLDVYLVGWPLLLLLVVGVGVVERRFRGRSETR